MDMDELLASAKKAEANVEAHRALKDKINEPLVVEEPEPEEKIDFDPLATVDRVAIEAEMHNKHHKGVSGE